MKIKIKINSSEINLFNYNDGNTINISKNDYCYSNSPNLLDVSITNYCDNNCKYCYKKSTPYGKHMSLADYDIVLKNAIGCSVNQIALGGGNPNEHPDFIEILKKTADNNIAVNYSTNGKGLTADILAATNKYCGAMALSIHDDLNNYQRVIRKILDYKIKLNLHIILSKSNMKWIVEILNNPPNWINEINAIIFLNYKCSDGNKKQCFINSHLIKDFFACTKNFNATSIGFDTCSISYLVNFLNIPEEFSEYCEAARYSAYISENLDVLPCSFFKSINCSNLKSKSLIEIWKSDPLFLKHRDLLEHNKCKNCKSFILCHGGCHIFDINYKCKNN